MPEDKKKKRERLRAAALSYRPSRHAAPRLEAKGEGLIAQKIIEVALEHGIPIMQDPDLVTILSKMDLDETISPALYEVVAELLVFVYRLKERWSDLYGAARCGGRARR